MARTQFGLLTLSDRSRSPSVVPAELHSVHSSAQGINYVTQASRTGACLSTLVRRPICQAGRPAGRPAASRLIILSGSTFSCMNGKSDRSRPPWQARMVGGFRLSSAAIYPVRRSAPTSRTSTWLASIRPLGSFPFQRGASPFSRPAASTKMRLHNPPVQLATGS